MVLYSLNEGIDDKKLQRMQNKKPETGKRRLRRM
jgi:hypothetical protein